MPFEFKFEEAGTTPAPHLPFGYVLVRGFAEGRARDALPAVRDAAAAEIRQRQEQIRSAVDRYDQFFRSRGFECPLPAQFERAVTSGLPTINPAVDALILLEMTSGTLMGAQDLGSIRGALRYGTAAAGETFQGRRGHITCRPGEIVLRDDGGIIASYFQGPDKRTSIGRKTRDLIFFCFSAPGLDPSHVEQLVGRTASLLAPWSDGGTEGRFTEP